MFPGRRQKNEQEEEEKKKEEEKQDKEEEKGKVSADGRVLDASGSKTGKR